jgi:hypothetical protein
LKRLLARAELRRRAAPLTRDMAALSTATSPASAPSASARCFARMLEEAHRPCAGINDIIRAGHLSQGAQGAAPTLAPCSLRRRRLRRVPARVRASAAAPEQADDAVLAHAAEQSEEAHAQASLPSADTHSASAQRSAGIAAQPVGAPHWRHHASAVRQVAEVAQRPAGQAETSAWQSATTRSGYRPRPATPARAPAGDSRAAPPHVADADGSPRQAAEPARGGGSGGGGGSGLTWARDLPELEVRAANCVRGHVRRTALSLLRASRNAWRARAGDAGRGGHRADGNA